MYRKLLMGALVTALVVTAAGVAFGSTSKRSATQLTLWHNYGTEGNAVATNNLVKAFEKLHPDIKVRVVSQPADNYFALLQSSAISHTSPDLATMWTGLFDLKYAKFLLNLKPYFTSAETSKLNGISYMAPDFNIANGFLVMPLENQFYIGFYNKALFAKAGLSGPPTNWNELYSACAKLKAKGITPMIYGVDTQGLGATFYPFYDFSYAMAGILSPAEWRGLYSGKTAWTSPKIVSQLTKWAGHQGLHEQGRADEVRHPERLHVGQGRDARRRQLGHRHAPEGPRQEPRRLRPALQRRQTGRRDPVPGRRILGHEGLEASEGGRRVPQVHDDAAGRQDHLGRGPDP
jgi:ABC-type glycerol-3-phosphate transport system substrate-binding protein